MLQCKHLAFYRTIAIVLAVAIAVPAGTLRAAQPDPLAQRFEQAREAWKNGDLETVRTTLLEIMASWDRERTRDYFQGTVHLLMGAVAEKLGRDDESVEHFCLARTFLGDRIPLEELKGETYSNYSAACGPVQVVAIAFRRSLVLFLAGDYARTLEVMQASAEEMKTAGADDKLRGKVSLLMGAVHEKLKNKKESIEWFCRAKALLGQGRSFSWLELSEYKYYKKRCKGVMAIQGQKKRGGGRFLGFLLGAVILGGAIWYLFINKNSPLKKDDEEVEKGEYTSITFRIQVTYKGLNSKGLRKLLVDNAIEHHEGFVFGGDPDDQSTCDDAITDKTVTITKTISTNSVDITQEYNNWDYVKYRSPGTNYKMLCTEWSISVQSYTWETGKADPGSPGVSGLSDLSLDTSNDCTRVSQRVHNCSTTATLSFNRPGSSAGGSTWYTSQTKTRRATE